MSNNPFNLLSIPNINNLNLYHNINDEILEYSNDLINKRASYNSFGFFFYNRLNKYNLPTNINNSIKSKNYVLRLHGAVTNKNDKIKIPPNVYIISLENYGKTWSSTTINYLFERMELQNNINESFIRSIIIEMSLLELFKLFDLQKSNRKSIRSILLNKDYYIQKYFKVYQPNDLISNFILQTEEHNYFYTGLSKLPTKSYIAYNVVNNGSNHQVNNNPNPWIQVKSKSKSKQQVKNVVNHNVNINNHWKVISHNAIKNALLNPYEKNNIQIIHKLLVPSNDYIRIEQNDYYTLHFNYLNRLKSEPKFEKRLRKMYTFVHNLNINVKTSINRTKTKQIYFKDIIMKLYKKENPTSNNPLVIFCKFCTSYKNNTYYPQDDLIQTNVNNIPIFENNYLGTHYNGYNGYNGYNEYNEYNGTNHYHDNGNYHYHDNGNYHGYSGYHGYHGYHGYSGNTGNSSYNNSYHSGYNTNNSAFNYDGYCRHCENINCSGYCDYYNRYKRRGRMN